MLVGFTCGCVKMSMMQVVQSSDKVTSALSVYNMAAKQLATMLADSALLIKKDDIKLY